eukprot:2143386-Alexandrium_andersonii.AAC.1
MLCERTAVLFDGDVEGLKSAHASALGVKGTWRSHTGKLRMVSRAGRVPSLKVSAQALQS